METTAYNFHDDDGSKVGQFNLHAGNEIKNKTRQCCNAWFRLDQGYSSIVTWFRLDQDYSSIVTWFRLDQGYSSIVTTFFSEMASVKPV
jgi:hypothetical protein